MKQHNLAKIQWHQHSTFLMILNILGGVISIIGISLIVIDIGVSKFYGVSDVSDNTSMHLGFAIILAVYNGGMLGFTLWAMVNNLSRFRIFITCGLWIITFSGIFVMNSQTYPIGILLFIITYFLTITSIKSRSITVLIGILTLFSVILALIFMKTLIPDLIEKPIVVLITINIAMHAVLLTSFFRIASKQRRQQAKQRRDTLAQGMLPEENYAIGDDGELIPIDEAHNNHKAQS